MDAPVSLQDKNYNHENKSLQMVLMATGRRIWHDMATCGPFY